MNRRIGFVRSFLFGAALSSVGLISTGAMAQTAKTDPVPGTGSLAQADAFPFWWFHGTVEAGGQVFLNNPSRSGSAYLGQTSLAKYYEYGSNKPGPFSNIFLATGSKDGLYKIEFGGQNIGYNDQNYFLDFSKAGQHYLSLGFDQTPHLYSTSAQTPFSGVGTNRLTTPCANSANPNGSAIVPCLTPTDIGIKRDTASFEYRWTPTDAWDVKADFSHLRRTGTQVDGVVGLSPGSATSTAVQVPKPVSDTTQNYGLNGEYLGTSPWGQRATFKLGYSGSQYSDDFAAYTIQNPYCNTTPCPGQTGSESSFAQLSLPPSNQANAISGTAAVDLPWKSRYVGTVSYTMMRQNAAFIPMTNNQAPAAGANVLPASSLNGDINTLLSNNVVTTKINSELTSKLSYRYYSFDNNTPEILFPSWVAYDRTGGAGTTEAAIRSLSISYVKQNAGEELNWRPSREWNFGAAYGFEHYSYVRVDADATTENSGKLYADWKPTSWFTARSSGYYSNRRYNNYDNFTFVGSIQNNVITNTSNLDVNPSYRQMMLDNRQRWKANVAFDMVVLPRVTITPNFKYQDDYYGLNPANQMGLVDSRSWNGGIDIVYAISPDTSVMVGYLREYYNQLLYGGATSQTTVCCSGANSIQTTDHNVVDTFTAMARYAAIPNKLDLSLRYTASHGADATKIYIGNGAAPTQGGQFPDVTTWFQRVDATAVYTFDKTAVANAGLKGEVKAKFRYAWERNSVSNWQNDPLAPWTTAGNLTTGIWLAGDNPNYNVHLVSASVAYTW